MRDIKFKALYLVGYTFLVCSCFFQSYYAQAQTVRWLVWDLAPEFIQNGPYKNKGFADNILEYFIENLPEYNHEKVWVNTERWGIEKHNSESCSPHIWGHFQNLVYSKQYSLTEPYGIATLKSKEHLFGRPGSPLQISTLLKNEKLRLGLLPLNPKGEVGSRYPVLEPFIRPYQKLAHLMFLRTGSNQVNLELLDKDRVDYIITFSNNVSSQVKLNSLIDRYSFFQLKEANVYKKIYVGCSDSPQGREVIRRVNKLINEEFYKMAFEHIMQWNRNVEYQQVLKNFYNLSKQTNTEH